MNDIFSNRIDFSLSITPDDFHWDRSLDHLSDKSYADIIGERKTALFKQTAAEMGIDVADFNAYGKWFDQYVCDQHDYMKTLDKVHLINRFASGNALSDVEMAVLNENGMIRFQCPSILLTDIFAVRSSIEITQAGYSIGKLTPPDSVHVVIYCENKILCELAKDAANVPIPENLKDIERRIRECLIEFNVEKKLRQDLHDIIEENTKYSTPPLIKHDFIPRRNWEYGAYYNTGQNIPICNIEFELKENAAELILKLDSMYTYAIK